MRGLIFKWLIFVCILCVLAGSPAASASVNLDKQKIHAYYQNGDFEKVIRALDGVLKSGRRLSRGDSVFLAKHLGVVYAANPDTRELGRYHMFRLLALDANADLLDMFVGEEVDVVFEKVRKEFALRNAHWAKSGAASVAATPAVHPATSAPVGYGSTSASSPSTSASSPAVSPVSRSLARTSARTSLAAPAQAALTRSRQPAYMTNPSRPVPAQGNLDATQSVSLPSPSAMPPLQTVDDAVPEWKGPVAWIGGGAAVAVLGLAWYFSHPPESPAKTYVVPRTISQ